MEATATKRPAEVLTGVITNRPTDDIPAQAVRVEGSRTVHLAGISVDRYDQELPAPACHTGIAGWDPRRLRASAAPVNCRRCLRLIERHQPAARVLVAPTLF